jgi:hypothetical protein
LDPREDEVGRLARDDLCESPGGGDRIARFRVDTHGTVGAHGKATPQRSLSLLVPDRHDDDLALAEPLTDLDRLLDGARVPLVQRAIEVVRIDIEAVRRELELVADDFGLLDSDDELQAGTASRSRRARSSSRSCSSSFESGTRRSRLNGSGTAGLSVSISRASR